MGNGSGSSKYLELPNGIPDSDTFRRTFECLNPKKLVGLMQEIVPTEGKTVAVDGKTICGSGNSKHKAYHVVSTWGAENQITLGQLASEEKSNEIAELPDFSGYLRQYGDD